MFCWQVIFYFELLGKDKDLLKTKPFPSTETSVTPVIIVQIHVYKPANLIEPRIETKNAKILDS